MISPYILFFKKDFLSGPDLAAKELGVVLNPATAFTLKIMDISYKVDKFEWKQSRKF